MMTEIRQKTNQERKSHKIKQKETNEEMIRYDLGEDYSTETAMVLGELYRHNGEWKFNAIGQGYSGGLQALCNSFGV